MSRNRRHGARAGSAPAHAAQKTEVAALAQAGRLDEAKVLASRLCTHLRKDPEAWFLLGAIHGHLKEYQPAADCCRKSIALKAGVPMSHYNLGIALHHLGHYQEAGDCFRRALALQPSWAEAHHDLGNALQAQGELDEAIDHYLTALRLRPGFAQAEINLGNALRASNDDIGAVGAYRRALQIDPRLLEAHIQLADTHGQQGEWEAAAHGYQRALDICPRHLQARLQLADAQHRLGDLQAAADTCRAAQEMQPDAFAAHYRLGLILQEQNNLPDAAASLRRALQIDPQNAGTWNNLGLVLHQAEQRDEAEDCYRRALAIEPTQPEAHRNLAKLLRETARFQDAANVLNQAVTLDPQAPEPHWDRALLRLLQGDFQRGWAEYEWRWEGEGVPRRDFGLPLWDGLEPTNVTLLVYAEQGVGDEIMFASCLPDLLTRTKGVVLECDPRLAPLFSRSFPTATVHGGPQNGGRDWLQEVTPVDAQIAIGSLPLHVRRRREDFPSHSGYLAAAPRAVRKWRQRYESLGSGLKVGMSWRGGRGTQKTQRSTTLDQWQSLFALPDIHWINLQYGDCQNELGHAKTRLGVHVHCWEDADPLRDLDDFAAQIAALDLVISIDNSTVHLAGALGVEVWTLQPFAPDWRWLTNGSDCHWYPSLRHFRQQRPGSWDGVFERLQTALSDRL